MLGFTPISSVPLSVSTGLVTNAISHNTNNLLYILVANDQAVNSYLKITFDNSHDTGSLLRATNEHNHLVDSYLRAAFYNFQNTNTLLINVYPRVHDVDSLLRGIFSRSHSSNLFARATFSISQTVNNLLSTKFDVTNTTDLLKIADFLLEHAADSLAIKEQSEEFSTDSVKVNSFEAGHNTSSRTWRLIDGTSVNVFPELVNIISGLNYYTPPRDVGALIWSNRAILTYYGWGSAGSYFDNTVPTELVAPAEYNVPYTEFPGIYAQRVISAPGQAPSAKTRIERRILPVRECSPTFGMMPRKRR